PACGSSYSRCSPTMFDASGPPTIFPRITSNA
ncbi:unnamed protein product, partial [Tilletia caries]